MEKQIGWKPIPLSLKILFVVFVLWIIGSFLNAPNSLNGIPFFGMVLSGGTALIVPLLLDVVGPGTFLYALWYRKSWAPIWAFSYISIFILQSIVALFTAREQFGFYPIIIPMIASIVFIVVIYIKKRYFK